MSSILTILTILSLCSSMVEQRPVKATVVGSSPTEGAKYPCRLMVGLLFLAQAMHVRVVPWVPFCDIV